MVVIRKVSSGPTGKSNVVFKPATASKPAPSASGKNGQIVVSVATPKLQPAPTPPKNTTISTINPTPTAQIVASTATETQPYWKTGGWQRVAAVLNPFNWDKIYLTNPNSGLIKADVSAVKVPIVAGEAALAVAGGAAALQAFGGGAATAAAATGAPVAAVGSLKAPIVAAGLGLGAGLLLGAKGGTTGPQTQSQAQNPSQAANPVQNPTLYDYSQRNSTSNQRASYSIRDSPGASIYGSQGNTPNLSSSFTPQQYTPQGQQLGQEGTQSAQAGGNEWLMLAAVAALVLFSRR